MVKITVNVSYRGMWYAWGYVRCCTVELQLASVLEFVTRSSSARVDAERSQQDKFVPGRDRGWDMMALRRA